GADGGQPVVDAVGLRDLEATLQERDGRLWLRLAEIERAETGQRRGKTERSAVPLGHHEGLLTGRDPFFEAPQLGQGAREKAPDEYPQHGRAARRAGATDCRRVELRLRPLEHLPRALVVSLRREHHSLVELRLR